MVFIGGVIMISRHSPRALWPSAICAILTSISVTACGGGSRAVVPQAAEQGSLASQRAVTAQRTRIDVSNTWTAGTAMPTRRYFAAAAPSGTNVYVIGGQNKGGVLGINEIYDTVTDTWSNGKPMPTKRDGLAVAAVNGIVYAIGGANDSRIAYTTVEAYDAVHNTWSTKAPLPTAVWGMSATVTGGRIYVVGG